MRLIVTLPLLILLVLFALSNREAVRLGLWPTGLTLDAPVSVAVLVAAAIAFLFGALFIWVGELGQRRRARRAEQHVRLLEEQVRELKAQRTSPALPPPL